MTDSYVIAKTSKKEVLLVKRAWKQHKWEALLVLIAKVQSVLLDSIDRGRISLYRSKRLKLSWQAANVKDMVKTQ